MILLYFLFGIFIAMFASDSGTISEFDCILIALFWPLIIGFIILLLTVLSILSCIELFADYIEERKYKKIARQQIIKMFKNYE